MNKSVLPTKVCNDILTTNLTFFLAKPYLDCFYLRFVIACDFISKSTFQIRKGLLFFSGNPNFFGPSYFETALVTALQYWRMKTLFSPETP